MIFFYVRILNVAIVICFCLFNYKNNATKWKKHLKCCKNNFYFLSSNRCLLQNMDEETLEKKCPSGVLLIDKKTEEGKKKNIIKTISVKPINEKKKKNNNNNIVLKNLNDEEINKQRNKMNEGIPNKNINCKDVVNISNNRQMGEKNIICKDINSNEIINQNDIKNDQRAEEIKEKLVKDLLKNKNKEIFKQVEIINSGGIMTKIKNSLYSLIFKGANFWKGLGIYIGGLSGAAIAQVILTFILKFSTFPFWGALAKYSFISPLIPFSSFIGLILLTIIIVILLLVWLWPSRGKLMDHNNREDKSDT
ncbi:exported protein family 4 Plasmodium exported, putative [Plasmodium sp. DRC-Itaito]|nr:exported protein family 4 Plasmodium exported, putative [Plasmodium sp. DRC-Itaito]